MNEKRLSLNIIMYAIIKTIVPGTMLYLLAYKVLNLSISGMAFGNYIKIINAIVPLLSKIIPIIIICLTLSKNKMVNVIGLLTTIVGIMINIGEIILCIYYKSDLIFSIILLVFLLIWLVIQIIYLLKKRN